MTKKDDMKTEGETLVKRMNVIKVEVKKLRGAMDYIATERDKEEKKGNTELYRKLNTMCINGSTKMDKLQQEAQKKHKRIMKIKEALKI